MEVESQSSSKDQKPIGGRPAAVAAARKKRTRNICLVAIAVILGLILILLIVGFTVFKAKRPVTTVNSVALKDFKLSLDITRLRVLLNVSLDVDLSVKNPNRVGFKYTNSSALLKYRNQVVGEAPLPAAKIPADRTVPMNLTLTLMADRLLTNSSVYSDVLSGSLPLNTFTRVSGKVQIFNIFKIHVVSYTSCDLNVDVTSRTVANQTCHYKTKL